LPTSGDYAIVDVTEGGASRGKILVLLDDEMIAREIAAELHRRGCHVVVEPVMDRPEPLIVLPDEGDVRSPLAVPT
jgi:hypothetical protein